MSICKLTPAANHQIGKLCQENDCYAIRLGVKGGGCAGFEYEWDTVQVDEIQENDELVSCDLGNFVIDGHSVLFLVGSTIDYKKDIIGAMFDIQNPNAQSACGCGVSVNFNMDSIPQF